MSVAAVTKATKTGKALFCALEGKKINVNHPDAQAYVDAQARPAAYTENGIDGRYDEALEWCREHDRWTAGHISKLPGVGHVRSKKIFETMKAAGAVPPPKSSAPPTRETVRRPAVPAPRAVSGHKKLRQDRMLSEAEIKQELFESLPPDIRKLGDMSIRDAVLKFGYFSNLDSLVKALKTIEDIHEKRIKNAQASGELVARDLIHRGVIDPIDTAHNRMLTDGAKTLGKRLYDKIKSGSDAKAAEKLIRAELTRILGPSKKKVQSVLRGISG